MSAVDILNEAREASLDGYNSTPPDATHGDGLDAAFAASARVLLTELRAEYERLVAFHRRASNQERAYGFEDANKRIDSLLAELDGKASA